MEFRNLMIELVNLLTPFSYAELGVKNGYTFNAISKLVMKAYAIDIVRHNSVEIGPNCEFFECSTVEFYNAFKQRQKHLDFIFIDADHSREAVLNDILLMKNFVRPYTGLIFLHDTYPINSGLLEVGYCADAWKAAKEIREIDKELEIVTIPGPWAGFSILRYLPDKKFGWMDN